jgi:hypothetical protein
MHIRGRLYPRPSQWIIRGASPRPSALFVRGRRRPYSVLKASTGSILSALLTGK